MREVIAEMQQMMRERFVVASTMSSSLATMAANKVEVGKKRRWAMDENISIALTRNSVSESLSC